MSGELKVEAVSPEAIFLVDSRQYELGLYQYDERIANALLCYDTESKEAEQYEEASVADEPPSVDTNP